MGGVLNAVFGGSSNKSTSTSTSTGNSDSESGNNAFNLIKDIFTGNLGAGNSAFDQISNVLGVGKDPRKATEALDSYFDSSGGKFLLDKGTDAVIGSNAARGIFQSGATGERLQEIGQGAASTTLQNYLGNLESLFGGGVDSAGLIAGTGQFSKSKSTSTGTSSGSGSGNSRNGIIPVLFGGG